MLRLAETKGTIYKAALKGNMVTASMQTGKKNQDGTWENMWWNVKFVGKTKGEILDCGDKTKIKIVSGNVETNKYNDKIYTNVIIFDYVFYEIVEGTKPAQAVVEEEDSFPF